jgi:ferredoxin
VSTRVTVDPDLCIGSAECVRLAPAAFAIDDDAGVSIPRPDAGGMPLSVLADAGRNCPTNAIEVHDADGSVVVAAAR